jgi:hypothetical protein
VRGRSWVESASSAWDVPGAGWVASWESCEVEVGREGDGDGVESREVLVHGEMEGDLWAVAVRGWRGSGGERGRHCWQQRERLVLGLVWHRTHRGGVVGSSSVAGRAWGVVCMRGGWATEVGMLGAGVRPE